MAEELREDELEISTDRQSVKTDEERIRKWAEKWKTPKASADGTWSEAPSSVIDLAREIIRKYHPDLLEARIGFLMRTKPSFSKGKQVLAKAEKVSEKLQLLLELDFLIWIDEDIWTRQADEYRRPIIDHELCHCRFNVGEQKGELFSHDVEEFNIIIERYGAWNTSLIEFNRRKDKGEITKYVDNTNRLAQQLSMLPPRGDVVAVDPAAVPADADLIAKDPIQA